MGVADLQSSARLTWRHLGEQAWLAVTKVVVGATEEVGASSRVKGRARGRATRMALPEARARAIKMVQPEGKGKATRMALTGAGGRATRMDLAGARGIKGVGAMVDSRLYPLEEDIGVEAGVAMLPG